MFHSVFCRSEKGLSARDLAEWIFEAAAFDEPQRFDPPLEQLGVGWRPFDVIYDEEKRPIQFMRAIAERCAENVKSAIETLHDRGFCDAQLADRLRESRQVFVIEFDEEGAIDDVWELLDVIETRIARELDGVIFSADEGFFDGHNKPIRSFL